MVPDQAEIERFWAKVAKGPACWTWLARSRDKDGYGLHKSRGKQWRAHRFAWAATHGEEAGASLVCHRCDNPSCVNPSHLFLGTARDNFHDCLAKGRYSPKGTGNAAAKLTAGDAAKIRSLYASGGRSQQGIGQIFGVTQSTVSAVIRGATWGS